MQKYTKAFIQVIIMLSVLALVSIVASADEPPEVRVVHAAPGLANIDIYVSDTLFFSNIPYKFISDYVPINSGDQTVKIRPAGVSPQDPTLREVTEAYNNERSYTIFIAGRIRDIEYWRIEDDTTLPGDGTVRVKVVHASATTPTTEFCIGDVCRTLAFKQSSDSFLLDPGVYAPEIRLNGVKATFIKIPPLELQNNSVHTVILVGQLQDQPTGLKLLYTFDAGEALEVPYPQPPPPGANPPPVAPPESQPPAVAPPVYPPVTGAFLSPRVLGMIAGFALIVLGGIGFWLAHR